MLRSDAMPSLLSGYCRRTCKAVLKLPGGNKTRLSELWAVRVRTLLCKAERTIATFAWFSRSLCGALPPPPGRSERSEGTLPLSPRYSRLGHAEPESHWDDTDSSLEPWGTEPESL